jgi:acylphosphatase
LVKAAVHIKVSGLVQGVFFRASMAKLAADLSVRGWVRNADDGSVEAFLEGEEKGVLELVRWARSGPPRARVDSFDVEAAQPRGLSGFTVEG